MITILFGLMAWARVVTALMATLVAAMLHVLVAIGLYSIRNNTIKLAIRGDPLHPCPTRQTR